MLLQQQKVTNTQKSSILWFQFFLRVSEFFTGSREERRADSHHYLLILEMSKKETIVTFRFT